MRIDIQFRAVLQRYGLDKPDKFTFVKFQEEAGIARKVISRLYHGRWDRVTKNQLERICQWLHSNGVPASELPSALFRFQPSGLVSVLSAADRVKIFLGDYIQCRGGHIPKYWVSWADSEAASLFVELLSGAPPVESRRDASKSATLERSRPRFEFVLVPSHVAPFADALETGRSTLESTKPARKIFRAMRDDTSSTTNILIGSPRANLLAEPFVADLGGCEPFTETRGQLPFYLYREPSTASLIPSCFGGSDLPAECPDHGQFGIYFRNGDRRWDFCPSVPDAADAGIVIVRRVPGVGRTDLALFGCSAQATRATGALFRQNPDRFWGPLQKLKGGIEARVYVCRIPMRVTSNGAGPGPVPVLDKAEVYPLELRTGARPKQR